MDKKEKLESIVCYLNDRFNQDSEEYSIFNGSKPQVIRFDSETAISVWACGAIVCIGNQLSFIGEDDGNWFAPEYIEAEGINESNIDFRLKYSECGILSGFSLGWAKSFIKAMTDLDKYVEENGEPYYYTLGCDKEGNTIYSENICGYRLK